MTETPNAQQNGKLKPVLASGGLQRDLAEKLSSTSGQHYYKARLSIVDLKSGAERVLLDYTSPEGTRPDRMPGIRFTAMTVKNDVLYVGTGTEVMLFRFPEMEMIRYATHPHFHDIHHVAPVGDEVGVVVSGLDMVIFLDGDTFQPKRYVNVSSDDLWYKFDPATDYRKVHTTQPHESHPNFLFEIDGKTWVTRCYKNDIVCLGRENGPVPLGKHRVHDGISNGGDHMIFTSVNGNILVMNRNTFVVEDIIDLNVLEETDAALGWCRGVCLDGNIAYVGFTTLRKTDWKENVAAFTDENGVYKDILPSRICAYDLEKRKKLAEYVFPPDSLGAVFSMVGWDFPLS